MEKGFIKLNNEVIGFGNEDLNAKELDRNIANEIIKENHYSKKFYNLSYIHLGVYYKNELKGCLQFGYAMNPASASGVVRGTEKDGYCELNRMWIDDICPRNSESSVISYSIKYIKNKYPTIKWIQSFADERCGRLGVVYQASNFAYYGEHKSTFWELDGDFYHNIAMTRTKSDSEKFLQENKDRAIKHDYRQFRYIYFIDKKIKRLCLLKETKYPKNGAEEIKLEKTFAKSMCCNMRIINGYCEQCCDEC